MQLLIFSMVAVEQRRAWSQIVTELSYSLVSKRQIWGHEKYFDFLITVIQFLREYLRTNCNQGNLIRHKQHLAFLCKKSIIIKRCWVWPHKIKMILLRNKGLKMELMTKRIIGGRCCSHEMQNVVFYSLHAMEF